jgi:hypothetical protein
MKELGLILVFSVWFLSGCNYTKLKDTNSANTISALDQILSSDEIPGFLTIKNEILAKDNTCSLCHSWVNQYQSLLAYVRPFQPTQSALLTRLKNFGGDMPKNSAPLSSKAVEILESWIAAGAPENPVKKVQKPEEPPVVGFPDEPVFEDVSKLVLQTNCTVCHNPTSSSRANRIPLQTFKDLNSQMSEDGQFFVTPSDLSQSAIWLVMENKSMPPKRAIERGVVKELTAQQLDLVKRWIEQGAKESL